MRTFAFLCAGLVAGVSLLANGPDAFQAAADGRVLTVLFTLVDIVLAPAFIVFLFLPLSSPWNVAIGGLLMIRGMDHIILGTNIGLWEHVPGQGDTAGALLVVLALALFANTLLARRDLGARI